MNRKWVLASILIATFLSAMEATVVTTAMKSIIEDLKGMELMNMTFSVYMLVMAITTPIYGKLADLYGRKRILGAAIVIFLIGSVLCGLAATMLQLVVFRAVQALGAGAILPVTTTIIGDIYTPEELTRMQALFSGVWAVSGVVGPLIGGLIVQFADWRWIFFINLPFGLASLVLLLVTFRETFQPVRQRIDWAGAGTFLVSVSSLLIVLLFGEREGYLSPLNLSLTAVFVVFLALFVIIERRTEEPFMPFELFRNRVILIPNLYGFLAFSFLISTSVYFPLWLQQLKHQTPTVSGFALACTTIGWPIGATVAGKFMKRFPPRRIALLGAALLAACGVFLAVIRLATPVPAFFVIMLLTGLGFGLCMTVFTILLQNAVEGRQRGITMSTNALMNTLGQTVFIALFGAVFNGITSGGAQRLADGIHAVFVCVAVITAAAFLIALRLPDVAVRDLFGRRDSGAAGTPGSGPAH